MPLSLSPVWEPDIKQIETTDPVVGGPPNPDTGAGVANIPHLQLGNRVEWLRNQIETLYYTSAEVDAAVAAVNLSGAEILSRLLPVDGPGSGLNADLLDGKQATAFWEGANAPFAHSNNGYQKLPNGLIFQWGQSNAVTNSFVISFPTAAFLVLATDQAESLPASFSTHTLTKTNFKVEFDANGPESFYWFAIGN